MYGASYSYEGKSDVFNFLSTGEGGSIPDRGEDARGSPGQIASRRYCRPFLLLLLLFLLRLVLIVLVLLHVFLLLF